MLREMIAGWKIEGRISPDDARTALAELDILEGIAPPCPVCGRIGTKVVIGRRITCSACNHYYGPVE